MTSHNCARCGSDVERILCDECDGDGVSGHDCGEDCCNCLDPEPNVQCGRCLGAGGWWHCLATPEWCAAHPLPGRENIERSTAEKYETPE